MICHIVTGATGFVGKNLVLRLLNLNEKKIIIIVGRTRPIYLDNFPEFKKRFQFINFDLTKSTFLKFPRGFEVDTVYHCAGVATLTAKWDVLWKTNVKGTVDLIEWISEASKIRQVVFISSISACGYEVSSAGGFSKQNSITSPNLNNPYGKSKQQAERKLDALAKKLNFHLTVVRPSYIFGPEMRGNAGFSQFIEVVKKRSFYARINYPGTLSFTYIDNFISFLILIKSNTDSSSDYFFSDSEPIEYVELFRVIGEISGKEIQPISFPQMVFSFFSFLLICYCKMFSAKTRTPVFLLPLLCAEVSQINFDKVKTEHKSCISVTLEEGLKKTISFRN